MPKKQYTYRHTLFACCRGYITQAIIINLAPLLFVIFQDTYSISYEKLGQLVLFNFCTQIVTDIWATKYADKIGFRKCMIWAHGLATLGLISLGILPTLLPSPYLGLAISTVIYAIGGGLLEVIVSPIVEALPNDNKSGYMSLLHSFYCWGQMIVVIVSSSALLIFGKQYWFILPIIWSLFPLYNLFSFLHVPLVPLVAEGETMKFLALFKSPFFYLAMILMICSGSSEQTMSQWSSLFAEKGLEIPKFIGDLLGPGLFALFMALGRTIYGLLGDRLPLRLCLIGSSILCIVTYIVTIFSSHPIIALIACGFCGFSVALMWPGTFTLSSATFTKGGTMMFGILAICGDIGCSFGPWFAGKISDYVKGGGATLSLWKHYNLNLEQIGLRTGLLAAILFPLTMAICLLLFRSKTNKQ